MMNQVILVGRIAREPEPVELEDGRKVLSIPLAVSRSFKNVEGVYETDFINCVLWNEVANRTSEYCKVGDVIGVKGRLQTNNFEDKDGNKKNTMEVVAERVTFLSTNKNYQKENNLEER